MAVVMTATALCASDDHLEDLVIKDSSDYVEINYAYNKDDGKRYLTQVIWWEWRDSVLLPVINPITKQRTGDWKQGGDFVVKDYRVLGGHTGLANIRPRREGKRWVCYFYDQRYQCIRVVYSKWSITTHTRYDPEMDNREIVDKNSRNTLTTKPK